MMGEKIKYLRVRYRPISVWILIPAPHYPLRQQETLAGIWKKKLYREGKKIVQTSVNKYLHRHVSIWKTRTKNEERRAVQSGELGFPTSRLCSLAFHSYVILEIQREMFFSYVILEIQQEMFFSYVVLGIQQEIFFITWATYELGRWENISYRIWNLVYPFICHNQKKGKTLLQWRYVPKSF